MIYWYKWMIFLQISDIFGVIHEILVDGILNTTIIMDVEAILKSFLPFIFL